MLKRNAGLRMRTSNSAAEHMPRRKICYWFVCSGVIRYKQLQERKRSLPLFGTRMNGHVFKKKLPAL